MLCNELERVMETEWQQFQKKDYDIGYVMENINQEHKKKHQAEIQAQMVTHFCVFNVTWSEKNKYSRTESKMRQKAWFIYKLTRLNFFRGKI